MANIIQAMQQAGIRRLICVSSSAVEHNPEAHEGFFFEKVLQPFVVNVMGKTLYADMRKMETLVMNSPLDWTIIRPSGLFETPQVTSYKTAEAYIQGKFTSRTDLANCMLRQLNSKQYLRKTVGVATVEQTPNLLQLVWKEGIAKKA